MLSVKVSETRGKRMKDFTLDTITPVSVAAAAVANQIDDIANNVVRDTVRSVSPVLKENAVKRISQKFSATNVSSTSTAAPPAVASPESAAPAASDLINEGYDVVSSPTTPQTYAVLTPDDTA